MIHRLQRHIFFSIALTGFLASSFAQTFPFNTWVPGSTSYNRTVAGNTMNVVYSESGNFRGNTLGNTTCFGYSTSTPAVPFFYNPATMEIADYSTSSCYCSNAQSGLVLTANWPNQVANWEQIDITFANPVCGPVTFNIWDINQNFTGSSTYFTDKIDISATNGALANIPSGNINIGACGSNTVTSNATTKTISGVWNGCSCSSTSVSINSGTVKTIRLRYWNGGSTYSSDPSSQYIIISRIVASPPPTASISAAPLACGSTTTTLTANTSATSPTYQWTGPGGSTIVSPNAASTSVTGVGTYTLTINPGGCSATASYNLVPSGSTPNISAAANQTVTCTATTISASSTTPGVTFSWSGPGIVSGGNTATPVVNVAGTYTVTVTNPSNGCINTASVQVAVNKTAPNANPGPNKALSCIISSIQLDGSSATPGATFSWTGPGIVSGGNTATPIVNAAGTYTLTVTNPANGCIATGQAMVSNSTIPPNANAGSNKTLTCNNTTVLLDGSSSTSGVTFSWTGPGIVSGGNTATPGVNATGIYTLTVTNPVNGCTNTAQVTVTSNTALPNANAGTNKTLTCTNTTVVLDGSSSTGGVTYSWAGPGIISGGSTATPIVNANGTYTLTVTNPANGCTNTAQVSVSTNLTPPNANAGTNKALTCTNPTAVLDGSSSTSGVTFSWSGPGVVSGGSTATPTVNAAGTYTLTVTNPINGCISAAQVNVTSNTPLPNANAGTNKTLTCTITTAVLDGSSSTAGATFSWSGPGIVSGGNTTTPTVNAQGTYTLTVTDPANGCTNTAQVTVNSNTSPPAVNAGSDKTLTCTVTSVVLDGSTSTPGATFSWSGSGIVSGGNTATPMVNAAGTYTLTVTDPANGCTATDQASVNTNTTAPNVDAGGNQTLPCGTNTITLSGSSSTTGVSFSWTGPGIVSGGNTATPTINANGTYILTVTNPANGCTATDQAVVTGSGSIPDANAGSGKTLNCTISSVTLDGSSTTPGATFSWSGPGIASGGNTATPTIDAPGTYTLTVTDPANGCTNTAQVTVTGNTTLPAANAGGDKTLTCTVTSVTLDGSSAAPGATFSWSGPGIVSGGNTATPTANATGTYTLTVTDPVNGCINTDQVSVSQDIATPDASIAAPGDLDCITTTLTLNGSSATAGAAFSWIGPGIISGGNTASPTIGQAGTYTLTVTNPANGCTNSANVTVNNIGNLPDINIATPNQLTCAVTQVTLSGSSATSGVTFSWSGPGIVSGANTATPVVNVAGSYTLTVTNPTNNCVSTANVTVISDLAPPVIDMVTPNEINCVEAAVVLSAFGNVSNPGYAWTGPGIVSGANTTSPLVNAAGNYTVTVTNLDNGCSDNAAVTVVSNTTPPQIAIATPGTLTCTTTSLDLQGSSTTPGVIFSWSGPGVVSGGNTATPTINAPGTYTLTVTDPANGCTNTAQVNVTASTNAPVANAGTDKILTCTVTSVTLNGSSATPGATFVWSGPGITSGGSTATPIVSAPGTYTLTVTNPVNGCTATDDALVIISTDLPDADAGPDQIIDCRASSVQLQGSSSTSGVTVLWSGPGITGGANTFTPTVNAAGTYTMTVTNPANGCVSSDVVSVRVAEPLSISVDITPNPCAQLSEGAIEITVEGGVMPYTFTWSNGSSSQSLSGITGGQYDLTVTDSTGCREELSYTVPQGIFELVAFYDSTINIGESIQLFGIVTGGSGEEVYAWSPPDYLNCTDCEDPLSTPLQNIFYYLTVTDTNGCEAVDSVSLAIIQFFELYTPSVFTPNGDGVNDRFTVLGDTQKVADFKIWIFNRWYETVFYAEDIHTGWDGTYKGTEQPVDVYTFAIQATFVNGLTKEHRGILVLLR